MFLPASLGHFIDVGSDRCTSTTIDLCWGPGSAAPENQSLDFILYFANQENIGHSAMPVVVHNPFSSWPKLLDKN
jgi:hypothetical protein